MAAVRMPSWVQSEIREALDCCGHRSRKSPRLAPRGGREGGESRRERRRQEGETALGCGPVLSPRAPGRPL